MKLYELAKDFAGPSATFIAACVAAVFAYRQWRTASAQADVALTKLKFETFEKRHDVLLAAFEMIRLALSTDRNSRTASSSFTNYRDRMRQGEFYFPISISGLMEEIIKKSSELDTLRSFAGFSQDMLDERQRFQMGELSVDLAEIASSLPSRFAPYLSFSLLKDEHELHNNKINYLTGFICAMVCFVILLFLSAVLAKT